MRSVGFDGSEQARQATRWAAHEASSRGCGLVIVHALRVPVPELVYTPMSMPLPEVVSDQAVRSRAESQLAELAAECERQWSDVDVQTCVELGNPAEVLSRAGRDADLIVVGSSGHSGLVRTLLGSVSADLVHSCERPIVVVRDDATRDGRVVVGVDGSETGAKAIDFAFEHAARHQRDLLAVHAWADLPVDALAPVREWDYNWNQVRAESDALLDAAEDAGLLVVGSHGRGLLRRALLGSVSHAVLYQAPCSVAVVHHDARRKPGVADVGGSCSSHIWPSTATSRCSRTRNGTRITGGGSRAAACPGRATATSTTTTAERPRPRSSSSCALHRS